MEALRWEKHPLQIISFIVLSTTLIFYIDINTPLGFMIGILYFIPVFLTVYVSWKYAPYLVTGVSIVLVVLGFLIAPRDVPELFALTNRVFFSVMLIVCALFIRNFTKNMENLRLNEDRYRSLTEWAPDAIVVQDENGIIYVNPSALHLFTVSDRDVLIGKNLINFVEPPDRDLIQQRMRQAMIGARIDALQARMIRPGSATFLAEASLGKIIWDDTPAVQVILRDITNREVPCRPDTPRL